MVNLIIDDFELSVPENTTILDAARSVGLEIPTLCFLKDINEVGGCRVCAVEVEGADHLVASCTTVVAEGMVVKTNSAKAREVRRTNVQLLLSQHDSECTSCVRSQNCSLQSLANDLGIYSKPYEKKLPNEEWNTAFPLIRDNNKCIKCLRCIQVCEKVQTLGVWDISNRTIHASINVRGKKTIQESGCVICGQCVVNCPTGALRERDDTERVLKAIDDPQKITLIQIAPSVRTSWGEELGLPREKATVERLAACLRKIGFDYIFDTDFAADLTIMEEATELIHILTDGKDHKFPLFTSCCPGWVRFVKARYPEFLPQLSSAKSPQQMFGAIAKSYYAEALAVNSKDIYSVSAMPCIAKKEEAAYPSMNSANGEDQDVDTVLTVRELCRMIKAAHIDVAQISEEPLDTPLGFGSGAGAIFGTTGGVMEAALRSAYNFVTGESPSVDTFEVIRGEKGWREATFELPGKKLNIAIAHGLKNASELLEALLAGEASYDFVEVMACPGGCVGGGGQPIHDGCNSVPDRMEVLRTLDNAAQVRFCHENPMIIACYDNYLGERGSERAHELLHTDHAAWSLV